MKATETIIGDGGTVCIETDPGFINGDSGTQI